MISKWWANFKYEFDILGQSHGQFIEEKMEQFLSGIDWDKIKIENNKKTLKSIIKINLNNVTSAVLIAHELYKDKIIDLIINSKKVTIDDIFGGN